MFATTFSAARRVEHRVVDVVGEHADQPVLVADPLPQLLGRERRLLRGRTSQAASSFVEQA